MIETIHWINVEDKLPSDGQHCLVWLPVTNICADATFENGQFFENCCSDRSQFHRVNHWAEMPVGPLVSWENGAIVSSETILDYAVAVFRAGIKEGKGFQSSFNDALMQAFRIYQPELFAPISEQTANVTDGNPLANMVYTTKEGPTDE